MTKARLFCFMVLVLSFSAVIVYNVCAGNDTGVRNFRSNAEEAMAYNVTRTTKTVDGLVFNVEEDRPIEKVAGVYQPMDFDSYVSLKFGKLQERINQLEKVLNDKIDQLANKVEEISKKVDDLSSVQAVAAGNKTTSN